MVTEQEAILVGLGVSDVQFGIPTCKGDANEMGVGVGFGVGVVAGELEYSRTVGAVDPNPYPVMTIWLVAGFNVAERM